MSILILGTTRCRICNLEIESENEAYSFPAFVINVNDPLYCFSDASFHLRCLENTKEGQIAVKYANLFMESIKPLNRICIIGGNLITKYENHIFIDYLTSDINEYLHKMNFSHIDKMNLPNWKNREEFILELVNLKDGGEWKDVGVNKYLDKLISQLS